MLKTTEQIETAWFKSIDDISGLVYRLKSEARTGNGDDHSSKLGLLLSQIFLATSDAMKINQELTKRYEREIWELACKHDGIDPDSKFVVFSRENPYQKGVA